MYMYHKIYMNTINSYVKEWHFLQFVDLYKNRLRNLDLS